MNAYEVTSLRQKTPPRVIVVGLASCFGCQVQVTNIEQHLLDVLGQIDLRYWQLASSDPMPEEYDVAVIEGAVTTKEAEETVRRVREQAKTVIAMGACACTAGIPGMASNNLSERALAVYGEGGVPASCGTVREPLPVHALIDVEYQVPCCPIDPFKFVDILQRALYGSNKTIQTSTLCGECKQNERGCFYGRETLCMGLVTLSGCGAKCTNLGRPCNGCAGLSPDANVEAARYACQKAGIPVADFDKALEIFNQAPQTKVEQA